MSEAAKSFKILCVDDEAELLEILADNLKIYGYQVITAESSQVALNILEAEAPQLVMIISDLQMPGQSGLELRAITREKYKDIPFIVLSAHISRELALTALELKIAAFLDKPTDYKQLHEVIQREGKERVQQLEEKAVLEATFVEEAKNILEELEPLIMGLEHNPNDMTSFNSIFRLVHTIKGSSGILDTKLITSYTHHFEDKLSALKRSKSRIRSEDVNLMLQGYDTLKLLMAAVPERKLEQFDLRALIEKLDDAGRGESPLEGTGVPDGAGDAQAAAAPAADTIRVPLQTLDDFMELSGEITVIRNMVKKLVKSIEKSLPGNRDVIQLIDLLEEMHKINGRMQETIIDMRKVSLATVFRPLPRTVRDIGQQLAKDIGLTTSGDALRIDSRISRVLSDSLIHLVRNSADHGLEDAAARTQQQKNPRGSIAIRGYESREEIIIEIEDDGRGIDPQRIKARLLEKGLKSGDEVHRMSERELIEQIFEPGFSTAQAVSNISGRGVGMDMVRNSVSRLKGRIDISTVPRQGTKFSLHLPIPKSVLIINSLIVQIGKRTYAIPEDSVIRLLQLNPEQRCAQVKDLEGGQVLQVGEQLFPMIDLQDTLASSAKRPLRHEEEDLAIVLARAGEIEYALIVDAIVDAEEVVVKSMGEHLRHLPLYAGATFLGDGSVGLILDVAGIAAHHGLRPHKYEPTDSIASAEAAPVHEYILFELPTAGLFAVPSEQVMRIERYVPTLVQEAGHFQTMIYRGELMPIFNLQEELHLGQGSATALKPLDNLIVLQHKGHYFGFAVHQVLDIVTTTSALEPYLRQQKGISGHLLLEKKVACVVDLLPLAAGFTPPEAALPLAPEEQKLEVPSVSGWGLF